MASESAYFSIPTSGLSSGCDKKESWVLKGKKRLKRGQNLQPARYLPTVAITAEAEGALHLGSAPEQTRQDVTQGPG